MTSDEPQIRGLPCRNCGAPVELAPDWRERVFDAVREANGALGRGTLDAAWREVEEELPEGWNDILLIKTDRHGVSGYAATASEPRHDGRYGGYYRIVSTTADGRKPDPTPTAALNNLAAELRAVRLRERA